MKIITNPDREIVERVRKLLKENDGYCPCALEKNEDTKCICKDFLTRQETGECHCGIFVKVEN